MALSKEVEIILKANAASVKDAYKTITDAAAAATDDSVKDTLNSYATKVADSAATVVERVLDRKNFASNLGNRLRDQVAAGAEGIMSGIQDAVRLAKANQDAAAAARLKSIRDQMQAFEKLAGEDFQDAIKIGVKDAFSMSNLRDATGGMADMFEKSLNGVDPNDLGGFAKALGGAAAKGFAALSKRSKAEQTLAMAAGDEAGAAAAGQMAVAMSAAAVAVTGFVAAIALFVAWAKAADDYQAKLNKTLLNGASVADVMGVAYQEGGRNLLSFSETMGAARKASVDTAVAFKMTTEETAGVLGELNSAGVTYKSIIAGASSAGEAQSRFNEVITRTINSASMLGVSVSELAQYQNTLLKDVHMSLDRTYDVFDAISKASEASGMATKTFFTAISQATSGMALYNVRIDQAIGLIKSFGKIVGETDAGKVFGEFTDKKSPGDRLKDMVTAIEGVGIKEVQDLFRDTTQSAVDEFQKNLESKGAAIKELFTTYGQQALGENLMSTDAKSRAAAVEQLANLPDDIRSKLTTALTEAIPEAGIAFRQAAMPAKGIHGDVNQMAGVSNYLDQASRIAAVDAKVRNLQEAAGGKSIAEILSSAQMQMALPEWGVSEEQVLALEHYRNLETAAKSIQATGAKGTDAAYTETLTKAGFTVEGDSVKNRQGQEIQGIAEIIRGMTVSMESPTKLEDQRLAAERQQMQGTITNALNAWVEGSLFENALASEGILGKILWWVSSKSEDPMKGAAKRSKQAEDMSTWTTALSRRKATLEDELRKSGGTESEGVLRARSKVTEAERKIAGTEVQRNLPLGGFEGSSFSKSYGKTSYGGTEKGKADIAAFDKASADYIAAAKAANDAVVTVPGGPDGVDREVRDQDKDRAAADSKAALERLAQNLLGSGQLRANVVGKNVKFTDVQDAFISKDGAMYHGPSADNILMFKDGGPLDPRTGGGGGNVVININGGDQAMVYRTVARAMRAAQA